MLSEPTNLELACTLGTVCGVSGPVEHLELWLGRNATMREQALQLHQDVQDLIDGKRESIVTLKDRDRG